MEKHYCPKQKQVFMICVSIKSCNLLTPLVRNSDDYFEVCKESPARQRFQFKVVCIEIIGVKGNFGRDWIIRSSQFSWSLFSEAISHTNEGSTEM